MIGHPSFLSLILLHLSAAVVVLDAQLLNDDFTSSTGHADATGITGVNNWSAQAGWVANDTAGIGYASCSSAWNRAMSFTALGSSLQMDETITVEAVWRGEGLLSSPAAASIFAIGISDSSLNSGNIVPALRVDVSLGADDTLRFGSGSDYVSLSLPSAYTGANTNTNWFKISMAITRLSSVDTFSIVLEVIDIDTNTRIGVVSYQAVDNATYQAAELFPAMRTLSTGGSVFTASHVDRFTVEAGTDLVPVDVSVDLSRQLFVGGVSDFSPKQFVNWHATAKTNEYTQAEAEYLFNDLEMRVGRNIGGFDWVRSQVTTEEPGQAGYIHAADLTAYALANQDSNLNGYAEQLYPGRAREEYVYADHAWGIPHEPAEGETKFVPASIAAAANWHSILYQNYWTSAGLPKYLEPANEPFVKMPDYFKPGTSDNWDEQYIIDFHKAIADQLAIDAPDVMVGGPCSAFPEFSRLRYDHFKDRIGKFIDEVTEADFVSWHIYTTSIDGAGTTSNRVGSNLDYMIDLVENYANNSRGAPLPIVISEYGGGIKAGSSFENSYSPARDWFILKNCIAKTVQFFHRPDRIEKAIPFIVEKATWYAGADSYPFVIYRRPDGPTGSLPYEETHLTKYYKFLKGLNGKQFPISSSDPDVIVSAIVNGAEANLIMVSVDQTNSHLVNLQNLLETGVSVSSATITRLYWDGSAPVFAEDVSLADLSGIVIDPEEAVRVKLNLTQAPQRLSRLHRDTNYGNRTIVEYTGSSENFTVPCSSDLTKLVAARVRVGVTRRDGTSPIPNVTFNGQALSSPGDWSGMDQTGRDSFDGAITFEVPINLIQASNLIQLSFVSDEADDFFSSVILEVEEQRSVTELEVISSLTLQGDNFVLTCDTLPEVSYQVKRATLIAQENFVAYGDTVADDGNSAQVQIPTTDSKAFFKVVATP
jgi:agarase